MSDIIINVGIKTKGTPIVKKSAQGAIVGNMLIGDGFHWQTSIRAELPGKISFFNNPDKAETDRNISLINSLPLEKYLECVVGSEMNPEAPMEFLKAHAVISRSWALGKIAGTHHRDSRGKINSKNKLIGWDDTEGHDGFHVCSDDHCQRYQGLQHHSEKLATAIKETEGLVLISPKGNIVDARFSKCCGGFTELFHTCWQPAKEECLESFHDPWCDLSNLSPREVKTVLSSVLKDYDLNTQGYGFSWKYEISKEEIRKNLLTKFNRNIGNINKLVPVRRGSSGRIEIIRIIGSDGYLDLGKELWIRRLLSDSHLYSSAFTIRDTGTSFQLSGKGWGHGVGFCQIGAANMALNGLPYSEILSFYYPGAKIENWNKSHLE